MGIGNKDAEDEWSLFTAILYGVLSFSVVLALALVFLLVTCRRRYALNWFEKNLLETARAQDFACSEEALMNGTSNEAVNGYGEACEDDDKFWVPPTLLPRSTSSVIPAHEASAALAVDAISASQESNIEPQPNDKSVAVAYRPRVSSMQSRLDHTKIDTSLYQQSDNDNVPNPALGSLHLFLMYDPPSGILHVRLIEAKDLRPRDFSGTTDPYAKIRLLPDRNNVWQTRIHKKTLSPVFDEDFVFEVRAHLMSSYTLQVLLYDFDAYSRHQCIGGMQFPLAPLELTHKMTLWKELVPSTLPDAKAELGDLMISLAYLPSAERLTVVVLKARNLKIVDDSRSTSDPYVRVILSGTGVRSRKKRTSVQRGTLNPIFNEALTFDVSREVLTKSTLEFCVLSDDASLGVARIGASSTGDELAFFREIISSRAATARWVSLNEPD